MVPKDLLISRQPVFGFRISKPVRRGSPRPLTPLSESIPTGFLLFTVYQPTKRILAETNRQLSPTTAPEIISRFKMTKEDVRELKF